MMPIRHYAGKLSMMYFCLHERFELQNRMHESALRGNLYVFQVLIVYIVLVYLYTVIVESENFSITDDHTLKCMHTAQHTIATQQAENFSPLHK